MLSLEECRKELGDVAKTMSDERILEVRDDLYTLSEIALDQYLANPEKFERR